MKKLIISLLAVIATATTFAQSSLLATLSHEGNITSYYGINALKEAVNAATNGDVITLSSGQFNAVNIDKAITVRGAGMAVDTISGSQPTILLGDFSLSAPSDITDAKLKLEGLYHKYKVTYNSNIQNAQVIKCRFSTFTYSSYMTVSDVSFSFIQCRINSSLSLAKSSTMTCINSYIHTPDCYNKANSNFDMQNCVVFHSSNDNNIATSSLNNCVIVPSSTNLTISGSNQVTNCIVVGNSISKTYLKNIYNSTNKIVSGYDMFRTFNGEWNDLADFILTDEAAKTYLGDDGTQVGIYGGMMPYETTVNIPQIKKFNVASKSTADGKLSVDIQVGVAE